MLPRGQAGMALPVRARGVVTWRSGRENLTIQDDSAGIWVSVTSAQVRGLWLGNYAEVDKMREGTEVETEGETDPGGYAPQILPKTLRVVGRKAMPTALQMDPARFFSGADDCQRLEVRGVVQGFQPSTSGPALPPICTTLCSRPTSGGGGG